MPVCHAPALRATTETHHGFHIACPLETSGTALQINCGLHLRQQLMLHDEHSSPHVWVEAKCVKDMWPEGNDQAVVLKTPVLATSD
mmetsp:Transcript_42907/g.49755  ORF Transcript_42907/g.49755 Transcript_42907/m.49755 type:complete len:86 (-) Transcript_42907:121-378(-)